MAKKPNKIVILAGDEHLVDVKVNNLNVRVRRMNTCIRVTLQDPEDITRGSTILMPYREPADFKINDIDIGEWEKWMERTENYRTLDNMLAWLKYHDEIPREPLHQSSLDTGAGGPFPKPRKLATALSAVADAAIKRAEKETKPPGEQVSLRADLKVDFPVTANTFYIITGHKPVDDDLERCNCKRAGEAGHWSCGMCRHGQPVFLCPDCFSFSTSLEGRQVHP